MRDLRFWARHYTFHYEGVLGTSLALRFRATSVTAARRAEQEALDEIFRLEKIFSSFDSSSELNSWRGTKRLSPELSTLLKASDDWILKTGGAFHPGVTSGEPLWRWEIDGTCTRLSDAPFTLNAIAKGEIADRVCAKVIGRGVTDTLVNLGGDLRVYGSRRVRATVAPDAENVPLSTVWLRDQALATSGGSRRGLHLIDPRTGEPVPHLQSASVIAPTARVADVLATVFCILSWEESRTFLKNYEGEIACFLVDSGGTTFRSTCWEAFEERE